MSRSAAEETLVKMVNFKPEYKQDQSFTKKIAEPEQRTDKRNTSLTRLEQRVRKCPLKTNRLE